MKRTLALFLTLCMALSMFSFPAFAAEADVAVLDEAALVETETTPASTEDVVAPVAAGTAAVQFKLASDNVVKTYKAATYKLADELSTAAVVSDVKYVLDGKETVLNAGEYKVEYTYLNTTTDDLAKITNEVEDAGSYGVKVTVTPTVEVEGVTFTPAEKSAVLTIKAFEYTGASATVAVVPDGATFGSVTGLKVSGLTLTTTESSLATAVATKMLEGVTYKAYSDNLLKNEITDWSKASGTVYVVVTLPTSNNWSGPKTLETKEVVIDADATTQPTAEFKAKSYTAAYTGKATEVVSFADVQFTGEPHWALRRKTTLRCPTAQMPAKRPATR